MVVRVPSDTGDVRKELTANPDHICNNLSGVGKFKEKQRSKLT
jgi:hypothetical protein